MTSTDKDMLTKHAASWLARQGAEKRREPIRAKTRQLRDELGLAPLEALR
jgi:hypothetical protein